MLDKTKDVDALNEAAPAIVVQLQSQIGPNRTMSMQFAIPLSMRPADLNQYVDKVMSVADRQNDKGVLEATKMALTGAERDLQTAIEQHAGQFAKFSLDHTVSNRRGDFKPSGAQQATLSNFEKTQEHLRHVVIPKLRKDIAELEAKIADGVKGA